jgi:CubicO group peptidase (beta-lactamase class C family)
MTKSVISAMVGVLVRQQKLTIDGPAPVAAWSDPRDPRGAITIDNLLRMTSGLDIGQSLAADWTSAFDPSSQLDLICPTWRRSPRETGGPTRVDLEIYQRQHLAALTHHPRSRRR